MDDATPARSPQLAHWLARLDAGWRPNRRLRRMGYAERAAFFGVTAEEYLREIRPRLAGSTCRDSLPTGR